MHYWLLTFTVLHLQSSISMQRYSGLDESGNYVLLMDNDGQHAETDEIEARRRSALDKNFMRFGRTSVKSYEVADGIPGDELEENRRLRRGRDDGFIRFGRTPDVDFIRFGRADQKLAPSAVRRSADAKLKNFIRFGKRLERGAGGGGEYMDDVEEIPDEGKRFKRSVDTTPALKRADGTRNFIRFGRNDNFMRFGRNLVDVSEAAGRTGGKSVQVESGKERDGDEDSTCNLHAYLNPFLARFQQYPVWMPPQNAVRFDDTHRKDKKLNTIRFG